MMPVYILASCNRTYERDFHHAILIGGQFKYGTTNGQYLSKVECSMTPLSLA